MNERVRAGGFLTTESSEIDLGEHEGVHLSGHLERRVLRIGFGGRRGLRLEFARTRPTAVEASSLAGVEVHRLRPAPDPWIEAAQWLVIVAVATALIPRLLRRRTVSHSVAAGRLQLADHGGAHGTD